MMNKIIIAALCLFTTAKAYSQDISLGIKAGYCGYLSIDKSPFYEMTPTQGYPGRFCSEIAARLENKYGLIFEFGIMRLTNSYHTYFPSDHGALQYKSTQQLFLTNASVQKKIRIKTDCVYGYIGPSLSLGFADIKESWGERFMGIAILPGLSQGVVLKLNRFSVIGSIDMRYLLLYNESSGGLGFKFDQNTLIAGQIGVFYSL